MHGAKRRVVQDCTELSLFLENFFRTTGTGLRLIFENVETFRSGLQIRITLGGIIVVVKDIPVFIDYVNINAVNTIQDIACR